MSRYLALIAIALLSACSHTPPPLLLTQSSDCPHVLAPGQHLTLRLPSSPGSGYSWQLNPDAFSELLLLSQSQQHSTHPEMVGAPGVQTLQFQAGKPSEGHLSLHYQRPWETEPIESFECFIKIQSR